MTIYVEGLGLRIHAVMTNWWFFWFVILVLFVIFLVGSVRGMERHL